MPAGSGGNSPFPGSFGLSMESRACGCRAEVLFFSLVASRWGLQFPEAALRPSPHTPSTFKAASARQSLLLVHLCDLLFRDQPEDTLLLKDFVT